MEEYNRQYTDKLKKRDGISVQFIEKLKAMDQRPTMEDAFAALP
jgi:hypothetical protein